MIPEKELATQNFFGIWEKSDRVNSGEECGCGSKSYLLLLLCHLPDLHDSVAKCFSFRESFLSVQFCFLFFFFLVKYVET
jgi:hypothetical protein